MPHIFILERSAFLLAQNKIDTNVVLTSTNGITPYVITKKHVFLLAQRTRMAGKTVSSGIIPYKFIGKLRP